MRWTVIVQPTRRPSERPRPHPPIPEGTPRCLACGTPLRRRWWQRGPLSPVQLCSWADESARACSGRERGL